MSKRKQLLVIKGTFNFFKCMFLCIYVCIYVQMYQVCIYVKNLTESPYYFISVSKQHAQSRHSVDDGQMAAWLIKSTLK